MLPNKPAPPVIHKTFLEDERVTGTGAGLHTVQITYYKGENEIASRLVQVTQEGNWEDSVKLPTDLEEGDKVTALQYINVGAKSEITEWIFPPKAPTVNQIHAGENVHVEGTAKAGYWLHQKHEQVGGGSDSDTYQANEDGSFRSLNSLLNAKVGDKVLISQSPHEFDDEDKHSKQTIVTVIE